MTKKAFNEIWTSVAILSLFTTLNTVLQTQGSELFFSFPKVNQADRSSVTIYGILISVPLLFFLIRLSIIYAKHHGINKWSTKFPIAFNRQVGPLTKIGRQYQRISLFLFFILPVALQYHLMKVFFSGCLFFNKKECSDITDEYYEQYANQCISNSFEEHLTNFQPFWCSWKNQFAYGSKAGQEVGEVTFFPGYQAWFFLLIEIGLVVYLVYFMFFLFRLRRFILKKKAK